MVFHIVVQTKEKLRRGSHGIVFAVHILCVLGKEVVKASSAGSFNQIGFLKKTKTRGESV